MAQTISVPKGLKNGDKFTRGGRRFVVISYKHPQSGTRVRYARALAPMQKALAKARKAATGTGKRKAKVKMAKSAKTDAIKIPKGKRVGDVVKVKQGAVTRYYKIATVPTANGGKRRYMRAVKAATVAPAKKTTKKRATKRRNPRGTTAARKPRRTRSNPAAVYIPGIGYI